MKKRWLIRSIFIQLLAVCVAAWVGSYWQMVGVEFTQDQRSQLLAVEGGLIVIGDGEQSLWIGGRVLLHHHPSDNESLKKSYLATDYHVAGFAYNSASITHHLRRAATIPLYFPTLFSTLLLWFVWRKTKAKPIGRAFPMEPAKKGEQRP